MPVHHVDAGTGAAKTKVRGLDDTLAEAAQDLAALDLHPLFLVWNIGDDVVQDIHAQDATVAASTGHSLHGGHEDLFEAKAVHERAKSDGEAGGGAIRLGGDEAFPA